METLQSKLEEAMVDIKVLRKQLQKKETSFIENGGNKNYNALLCSNSDYEQLVQSLEKFQKKVSNTRNYTNINERFAHCNLAKTRKINKANKIPVSYVSKFLIEEVLRILNIYLNLISVSTTNA